MKLNTIEGSPDHWWVTTIPSECFKLPKKLKGHQIIGELRLMTPTLHCIMWDWRVTRSLVSYDLISNLQSIPLEDWRVTRSLVSYDYSYLININNRVIEGSPDHWWVTTAFFISSAKVFFIEGSPDHWWVTTWPFNSASIFARLKGHQIIGELRPLC